MKNKQRQKNNNYLREYSNLWGTYEIHVYKVDGVKGWVYEVVGPTSCGNNPNGISKSPELAMKNGLRKLKESIAIKRTI